MQKEKRLIPELRFAEFEGIWVMEKLGERCSKIGDGLHGTPQYVDDSGIYFINGNNINSGKIEVYENTKQVSLKDYTKNKKLINLNSLLISLNGTIGNIGWYNNEPVMLGKSVGYLTFSQKPLFEYHYLNTPKAQRFFISQLTGTTIKNLSLKTLRDTSIFFPQPKEQQKIANFLTAVDNQIQTLEKKKTLLEQYKKGVMQKLFKQELRFKDDNGNAFAEWEEEKLGEYLVQYNEKSDYSDQYPVLTSSRKGIMFQTEYYSGNQVASKDNTGYNIVPRNYFTYRHMSDDLVFKFNRNTICDKGIVSTLYPVFTTKNIDDKFLEYKLNEGFEIQRYALLQKQGGSRTYLYFKKLSNMKMNIPCLKEQTKIANFLSSIDENIALVNTKIEHTKAYKKGLLQQMFV